MPLRGLALLIFVLGSIPICFFRPFYGIVVWTVFAFLNPQSFTWGAATQFNWAAAIAIPTLAGMIVFERRLDRLFTKEVGLLLILWGWFTITTFVSTGSIVFAHHAADTWARYWFVSKILLMTLCLMPLVNSLERLRYLILTIAACFGFFVLKTIPWLITTGGVHKVYGPEGSMIGDNTDFGLALTMTLPLFLFLATTETRRWAKTFWAVVFVLAIPVIFFTYSRGALVGLMAVSALLLLKPRRAVILAPVAALAVFLALSFAPENWKTRMAGFVTSPEQVDNSGQARLDAWAYARALAADYPIAGGGFATYTEPLYQKYWPTEWNSENVVGPHSIYFQVLAEHGYVGLVLYMLIVLTCFISLWRLQWAARKRKDKFVTNYAQMFQLALVGFLTTGAFLGRAYFDYYFTIVACISILEKVAREQWQLSPAIAALRRDSAAGLPLSPLPAYGIHTSRGFVRGLK
jgi:probable O-glycosylation ligase (exosortase A-associated)